MEQDEPTAGFARKIVELPPILTKFQSKSDFDNE